MVDAVHGVTESDTTQQLKNSKARFILLLFALFSSCSEVCQEGYGYLFIYFWPCWVFAALHQLSLLAVSEGSSVVAVHVLLIAVVSLVAERGFQGSQAQ